MKMFINNIDPVAFRLGPLEIRYYGIIFAFGFILALLYLEHLRKKGKLNLRKDDVYDLLLYIIIGVVAGSRLGEVLFWEPSYYFSNPLKIFAVWEGGMSFHGGLIGIIVGAWLFSRRSEIKKRISFLGLADAVAVPAAFALALGRLANFINGELVGAKTGLPWCVQFSGYDGCRHPVQLYGFAGRFMTGLFVLYASMKKHAEGFLFVSVVFLFGFGRLVTDFLREDPRLLGLSMGQYLSAVMVLVAAYFLLTHYKEDVKHLFV
ncbi:prolipoprotein diacylglyceryl transferase [Candidatus Woesearchaeota archaeon]|nr:prolipoprotein diacylglyceryl transferase [Candidatus Woesearchaeota archaeon]